MSLAHPGSRFAIGLAGVALIANTLTPGFALADASGRNLVLGLLPFALIGGAAWLVHRLGWRQTGFALVPTIAFLILLELGFSIYYHRFADRHERLMLAAPVTRRLGDWHLYEPHHYGLYNLNRDVALPEGTRHNQLGLRDERALEPDPDAIRIVFLGGSTTYTIRIRDNQRIFSAGLERMLQKHYAERLGSRHIQVVNAGLGAATSAENLIRLAFFISEIEPDLLVIQHGLNDARARMTGVLESDYGNYRKRWEPPSPFRRGASMAYGAMVAFLGTTRLGSWIGFRTKAVKNWQLSSYIDHPFVDFDGDPRSNNPRYFERNTRFMIALAREIGALVVLATTPFTERLGDVQRRFTLEHQEVLRRVAEERDVHFFDFASEMPLDDTHLPDAVHVSQQGSDAKRDLYFTYLSESGLIDSLLDPRP